MSVTIDRVDGLKPEPVRTEQLAKRFHGNRIPGLEDLCFEILGACGPPVIGVTDPLDHPGPHDLNEVEVGTVGRPVYETCGDVVSKGIHIACARHAQMD